MPGHFKKDCLKYKKWKNKGTANKVSENLTDNSDHYCFSVMQGTRDKNCWYIDSGATPAIIMSNNKTFFKKFTKCTEQNVKLGDGKYTYVLGFGSGDIPLLDNNNNLVTVQVKNVLYVPVLEENLLSVRKLTKEGFEVYFKNNTCSINKNNKVVALADMLGNLYKLRTNNKALVVTEKHNRDCLHAWHRRLGHRDPESVKKLNIEKHVRPILQ